jgi:hypothetical protein
MGLSATAAFATNHDCVASVVAACIACSPSAPRDRIFGEGQGPVPDADVPLAPVLVGDAARVGSLRSLLTRRSCHPGRLTLAQVQPGPSCSRSRPVWAAILRAHPQLSKQEPANSTSGDEDEERRHAAVVQKADYDIDPENHQERQYRTQ